MLTSTELRNLGLNVRDPVLFSESAIGADLWGVQRRILDSVSKRPRTAVKACHSSGKTFVAALAALWWITRWSDGIVITTAPTWVQVEKLLWGEIHRAVKAARGSYPNLYPETFKTELRLGPGRYAMGLSTNEGVRFQGFHGHILVIVDEATGVLPEIWTAIDGIRAGGDVRVLALGNPVVASGPFYDAFAANRDGWSPFTISAFDTPNFDGVSLGHLLKMTETELDANPRPYLTVRRWVHERYHEWGVDSADWQARVLGNFPDQSEDSLISMAWIEGASKRLGPTTSVEMFSQSTQPLIAGVDVAGPGEDETSVTVRQGQHVLLQKSFASRDPRGDVLFTLLPFKGALKLVNVDSVGLGYYFAIHLKDHGLPVNMVNVGAAPKDTERFDNLKAELYWKLRMTFQQGDLWGLTDPTTMAQLSTIRYTHTIKGKVVIESKDQARARGVRSPDRAESLMLAYAYDQGLAAPLAQEGPDAIMAGVSEKRF